MLKKVLRKNGYIIKSKLYRGTNKIKTKQALEDREKLQNSGKLKKIV